MGLRGLLCAALTVVAVVGSGHLCRTCVAANRAGRAFNTACSVDWRNPIPPEWLRTARIDHVFIYSGQPIHWDAKTGEPTLRPKTDPRLVRCFELYKGTGIKVLLLGNFYCHAPKDGAAVDAAGRRISMACLGSPAFAQWLRKTIAGQAKVFSRFEAFGGFCFDDASGVRCDCCYCPRCGSAFKAQTGQEPPRFTPADGTGRIDPNDPRLLWDAFHRRAYGNYTRIQSEAVRSVSRDALMVTIPADSHYYGHYLNCKVAQPDTPKGLAARLQRITRFRIRHWAMFQAFPFPRLPEPGESGFRHWAIGAHICQPSTAMIEPRQGPVRTVGTRSHGFFSPAEIRRLIRVTVAEGAPGIAYWGWPSVLIGYPEAFDAIADVHKELPRLAGLLAERRPVRATVGVLHATATEVLEQPWRVNMLERWRHLHAWEGVAYTLRRAHVAHRIVMDTDLDVRTLDTLRVLVLAGVRFLTQPCAQRIEQRIARGRLTVLADPQSLPLKGATVVQFDPYRWYRKLLDGYRQPWHLDAQRAHLDKTLVPMVVRCSGQRPGVRSEYVVSFTYRDARGQRVVFLANWDLEHTRSADVAGLAPGDVTDLLGSAGGLSAVPGGRLRVSVAPAGWRVLVVKGDPKH